MSVPKNKLFKAIAWFVAVVVVLTLFLVFAQMMSEKNEFLKNESLNIVLMLVSGYIVYDLAKKYPAEKKKSQLFGIILFSLIILIFLAYFGTMILG